MLQWEHSAILSTFIKLPFVIKIFLSNFEWPLKTDFTIVCENGFKILHKRSVTCTCKVYDVPHYVALIEPHHV